MKDKATILCFVLLSSVALGYAQTVDTGVNDTPVADISIASLSRELQVPVSAIVASTSLPISDAIKIQMSRIETESTNKQLQTVIELLSKIERNTRHLNAK